MRRLCELPEEIMMEILLRLPPVSLIRFKCVSKSWYALISDPSFTHKHLHFNKSRVSSSTSLFLSWLLYEDEDEDETDSEPGEYGMVRSFITIFDNDDDEDNNDHIPCVIEDLNLSMITGIRKGASHCNGIIWLATYPLSSDRIVLYNFTIRELKVLPKTCLDREALSVGGLVRVYGHGFGYDSKSNDYKFIRILRRSRCNECFSELYTMSSDSWTEIQIDIKIDRFLSGSIGVCCKRVFFWLVAEPDRILSFDMSSDEFHNVTLPVDVPSKTPNTIVEWKESLALLISDIDCLSIEMWVMDDYHGGVEASWTKHLKIRPLVSFYTPIMLWKSDELLLETKDGRIVSYSLGTQKARALPNPVCGVSPRTCVGDIFMGTLVSVKGGN